MHSDKAEVVALAVSENACRHKRVSRRNISFLNELAKLVRCLGKLNSTSKINEGALCSVNKLGNFVNIANNLIRAERGVFLFFVCISSFCRSNVLGNINKYGTRSAAFCYFECLTKNIRKILNSTYNEIMLCYRHCNTRNINLLEAVCSNKRSGNVTCNCHHRNTIHISRSNTCYKVCCTGTTCCYNYTCFTGGASITVSGVSGSLLVRGHIVRNFIAILIECIVNIQYRASGITENPINSLL